MYETSTDHNLPSTAMKETVTITQNSTTISTEKTPRKSQESYETEDSEEIEDEINIHFTEETDREIKSQEKEKTTTQFIKVTPMNDDHTKSSVVSTTNDNTRKTHELLTTEFNKEVQLTVTPINDEVKNNYLLEKSMTSREEEFTSPSTEKIFVEATKLIEKTTDLIKEFFELTTTTKSSEIILIPETTTELNEMVITESTTVEKECLIPPKVCETNACKKSASKMLALMDHTADPCEDFYKFSCGGMKINQMEQLADENYLGIEIEELPDDKEIYLSKFKTYYQSCVNFDAGNDFNPATLKILLDRFVKGLNESNSKLNDLTDLIAKLILSHPYGSSSRLMPLFDVVMDIGPDKKYIPVITLPFSVSDILAADTGDIYEHLCLKNIEKFAKTEVSTQFTFF